MPRHRRIGKAQGRDKQLVDEYIDDPNRAVSRHIIVHATRQKKLLSPVATFDETPHHRLPNQSPIVTHQRVFTQPRWLAATIVRTGNDALWEFADDESNDVDRSVFIEAVATLLINQSETNAKISADDRPTANKA